jgi:NADH-quinone oxidoreductase subunit E
MIKAQTAEETIDLTLFTREPQQLIAMLQYFQSRNGYISRETVLQIAEYLGLSEAHIYGVASFYTQFRFEKPGDHQVRVCMGTACHVQGGKILSEEIRDIIGIQPGEITPDHRYEFHEVACLGCCAQAPVVEMDGRIHGKVTRKKLQKVLKNHE